jgi:hypothetical protein
LYYGGGLPMRSGWYRNSKYRWLNSLNNTFSWSAVVNQSQHLGYRNVSWVRTTKDAMNGDIVYWKYREWKNIGHTSVITALSVGRLVLPAHGPGRTTTCRSGWRN